ncbi:MAG: phenylalanine--tRNA ligase subunit alpha [Candidatus Methanospirare jalkutatii]|nr:MAG: phenylalanine--tRNA ligase subunit alpha [Candidatus Methanospirare jalkutatii]
MRGVGEANLTAREKLVLKALSAAGEALTPKEIAERTGLKEDAASQIAFILAEKGFVKVKEREEVFYRLTEEGKEYAERGLPERRALSMLKERACSIDDLKASLGEREAKIAVNWLLKKGWARIERKQGKSMLVASGAIHEQKKEAEADEEVLRFLRKGTVSEEAVLEHLSSLGLSEASARMLLKELAARKLLSAKTRKERKFVAQKEVKMKEMEVSLSLKFIPEVTQITPEMIRTGSWRSVKLKEYDVKLPAEEIYPAKVHPYQRLVDEMRRIFTEMGFVEIKGDVIQSAFWNFDALFVPQDHPAREMQDTFYLGKRCPLDAEPALVERVKEVHEHGGSLRSRGWGGVWSAERASEMLLRTHTTAVTLRYLASHREPPVKVFCIGRVYRRETLDPTHLPEFDQLEGIVMDEGVTFRDLLGILQTFYRKMGFPRVRFRPGYFPYTEPSVEVEVFTKEHGWIELGGAGIFREEVTNPIGVRYPVLAWGLGIGRLAMLKLRLKDIRQLYQPDIAWLRRSSICD